MTAEYRAPTTRIGRFKEALFLSIRAAGGINHPSAPDECLLKAPDEVYARVKALRAERDAAIARAEAAEAQVAKLREALADAASYLTGAAAAYRENASGPFYTDLVLGFDAAASRARAALASKEPAP